MLGTISDARRIRDLLEGAEREAAAMGEVEAGAEHVLLAACELPDGTARRALEGLGVDAPALREAVLDVHRGALGGIDLTVPVVPAGRGLMRSKDTVRALLEATARERKASRANRFSSAHVLLGVTDLEGGTPLLALQRLGVTPQMLRSSAESVLADE